MSDTPYEAPHPEATAEDRAIAREMEEQAAAEAAPIDGTRIQTVSGLYVDPLNLRVEDVRLEDIAHALSNQCRFSGHTRAFYSVAEHSVRVAGLLQEQGCPIEVVLHGLLHDASEAYLTDMPRPLKTDPAFGERHRAAEGAAQAVVLAAFNLGAEEPEAVKVADNILLATERRDLMPKDGREWAVLDGVPELPLSIRPLGPVRARDAFLATAHQLLYRVLQARSEAESAEEAGS